MPVPTLITDLSTTAASNYPAGSDSPSTLDDTQRALAAFIAQLRDGTGFTEGAVAEAGANSNITSLSALTSINGAGFNKNAIINGGFTVNQRAYVSGAVLAAGAYGHDRWKAGAAGGNYTFTQLASNTQITIAASKTLIQVIEDKNVHWTRCVISWEGTAQARVGVNSATPSGAFAASPIVVTTQTAGTVMSVEFGNGGSAGTLGKVQVEATTGSIASAFESRPFPQELALCQRYFYSYESGSSGFGEFGIGYLRSTTSFLFSVKYPTPMRVAPSTFSFSGVVGDYRYEAGGTTCVANAISSVSLGSQSSTIEFTSATVSTVGFGGRAYAAGGTRYLSFSAEL